MKDKTKMKMSITHTGMKHSEATKKKISAGMMGHRVLDSTKEKQSIAAKRNRENGTYLK